MATFIFNGNAGQIFKHKEMPYLTIELVEPTAKGWKVRETNKARRKAKAKTAYYYKSDLATWFVPA